MLTIFREICFHNTKIKKKKNVWHGGKSCHTLFENFDAYNVRLSNYYYMHKFSENANIAKLFQRGSHPTQFDRCDIK